MVTAYMVIGTLIHWRCAFILL